MKIRVLLVNETSQDVPVNDPSFVSIDPKTAALTVQDSNGRITAAFGPGCWLSAVKVADED